MFRSPRLGVCRKHPVLPTVYRPTHSCSGGLNRKHWPFRRPPALFPNLRPFSFSSGIIPLVFRSLTLCHLSLSVFSVLVFSFFPSVPHTSSQTFLREFDKKAEWRHSCRQPVAMATGMSPLPDTLTRDQHPDLRAEVSFSTRRKFRSSASF